MPAVLIVDDDADLLGAVAEALADEGWTVLAAASGMVALELAQSNAVDVVLADLALAEGDGRALEEAFRALGPGGRVPFVFMTGFLPRAREIIGPAVVMKPFEVGDVVTALEDAIRQRPSIRRAPRSCDRQGTANLDRVTRQSGSGS